MIAPSSSMYSSNDMVHNHYLEKAKKKIRDLGRNSKTSVMPSARSKSTSIGCKPKPRSNTQTSRNWLTSKSNCVTTKTVDSEPTNALNEHVTNQYEYEQTLDVSAGTLNLSADTSFNPKKEGLRVCSELEIQDHSNEPSSSKLVPKVVPSADTIAPSIKKHPSDTKVITVKMEILLEPTSNKLLDIEAPKVLTMSFGSDHEAVHDCAAVKLEEALKEKDDLKLKLKNFEESSKNLTKLINSQISVKDKTGLGSDSHVNESEVLDNVVDSHECNQVNDRFKKSEGYHAVPPPFTRNFKPTRADLSFARRDFAPTAVLTKSGIVPISAARQSSSRAAAPASAARPINTAAPKPFVNVARPRLNAFHMSHLPFRIPFNQQTTLKNRILNDKVNTAKVNSVNTAKGKKVTSAIGEQGINDIKSSACWIWRPKGHVIDHISKDSGSYMPKNFDYGNPQYALQDQGIFDSGCSRHMTGNKFYLSDYQDIDGGFIAFGGSSKGGKITGKGTKTNINAGQAEMSVVPGLQYVLLPFLTSESQNPKSSEDEIDDDAGKKNGVEDLANEDDINGPREATNTNGTNRLNTVSSPVNTINSSLLLGFQERARDQEMSLNVCLDNLKGMRIGLTRCFTSC
ncbi:hypothetical protein Tco_1402324 [Tanacetum coccineum]